MEVLRPVYIPDKQHKSKRNIIVSLTKAEKIKLLKNPKVKDIVLKNELDNMNIYPTAAQTINPVLSSFDNQQHDNWALDYCADRDGTLYTYRQQGEGVDIIVIDSGVDGDHDEFMESGVSRLQKIEWEAGQSTNKPNHYNDEDGHGTAVASCAAGKTQGFARKARIYAIKVFDTDAYTPLGALQNARDFHNAKTGTSDEGRPTVVNNSWSYTMDYPTNHPNKSGKHPIQVNSVDAEIESMVDDGMIVISASGNESHYIATSSDSKYNEFYYIDSNGDWTDNQSVAQSIVYPNRATPSGAYTSLCVGSNGELPSSKSQISYFSNFGTRVDIFAPGRAVQCAEKGTTSSLFKINGTSFSSPHVAGIIALYVGIYPAADQEEANAHIESHARQNEISGNLSGANNVTAVSSYNGLTVKYNNEMKDVAFVLIKKQGEWVRLKSILTNQSNEITPILGRA